MGVQLIPIQFHFPYRTPVACLPTITVAQVKFLLKEAQDCTMKVKALDLVPTSGKIDMPQAKGAVVAVIEASVSEADDALPTYEQPVLFQDRPLDEALPNVAALGDLDDWFQIPVEETCVPLGPKRPALQLPVCGSPLRSFEVPPTPPLLGSPPGCPPPPSFLFLFFFPPPSSPPTQRVGTQPLYPQVEESLLKRRTRVYTQKYQPAYSFSLYAPPPPRTYHQRAPPPLALVEPASYTLHQVGG